MKSFYVLALVAILLLACSLTNGATSGAVILATPSATPAAARSAAIPTNTPRPEHCTVTTGTAQGRLNLRACPGTDCGVIFVLDEGDRLTVLAAGDWLNVQTETGAAGYINSNYCRGAK